MDVVTLQSKTRKRHIVRTRQLAMYFAKRMTKTSLASIGSQQANVTMQLCYTHVKLLII